MLSEARSDRGASSSEGVDRPRNRPSPSNTRAISVIGRVCGPAAFGEESLVECDS